ncbi:hypothetical protein P4H61_16745 [Paenibacillus peoriae]|uniref:hypothetical protein n=1 Tax=Paenibacillus peoriae TaxID=59893 RepID=UPI00026C617F|nr:hypothetical protein [Paenibacillus peoriae]MEC0183136.1 hypothetical protein [Paenibacillus peoriae]
MTTTFTKITGVGFIILSVLRLTPFMNATGKWLLYISIAAFFLILYDLLEFIVEGIWMKKGVKLSKFLFSLRSIFLGCAVMAIIVLPNLKINISVKEVNTFSDAFTLISLGIVITLIGFKTERVQTILYNRRKTINNEVREFLNSIEGQSMINEHIEKLRIENTHQINKLDADSK